MLIAAQIIGFAAVGLYLLSYQLKKRAHIVWVTFASNLFYVLQYVLLGAFSGAILDVLSTVVSFLAARKNAPSMKRYARLLCLVTVFATVLIGVAIALIRRDPIELIPVAGAAFQTVGLWCDKEQTIRKFGLCGSPFWLAYNLISKAYGAALGSTLAMISIITSLIRYGKKREEKA